MAAEFGTRLSVDLHERECPPEVRQLGRAIKRWAGPDLVGARRPRLERGDRSGDSLIKRIRRIGFVFTAFANYSIRVLLYPSKPNWDLLATITRH